MKVHLIRSEGFDMEDYNNVFNILNQYTGTITFEPSEPIVLPDTDKEITYDEEDDFTRKKIPAASDAMVYREPEFPLTHKVYTWDELFEVCKEYRNERGIPESDHVILLTDQKNTENWFGAIDESLKDYFVETSDWPYYFKDFDSRFPIVYCIAGWLMRSIMFESRNQMQEALHEESIGCLMDFCEEKKEITLKMRTADICENCLGYSERNDVNRAYMNQLLQVMDGVRSNLMFRDRSRFLQLHSRLEIRGMMHHLFLTDLGDLQINLNPKERALYVLYLNHPEGISRSSLIEHKEELRKNYAYFSNAWDNDQIAAAVNRMTDILDNNMNEVLSRIRSKFKKAVGDTHYKSYSIEAVDGVHRITLDRELVTFDRNAKLPLN